MRRLPSMKKGVSGGSTIDNFNDFEDDRLLSPIFATEEHKSEFVYSDLLQRLMVFVRRIHSNPSWREHLLLVQNLTATVALFYLPELQELLLPILFDLVYKGNKEIKQAACECLVKILKHQHHQPSREVLIQAVQKELAGASSWLQRKSFISFCKAAVTAMPRDFFKLHLLKDFLSCAEDKVA